MHLQVGMSAMWSRSEWSEPVIIEDYDDEFDTYIVSDKNGDHHEVSRSDLYDIQE